MLALLTLPLLAMSARGQVVVINVLLLLLVQELLDLQVEDRSLLEDLIEDLEQHQYPDYQQYK